MAPHNESRLTDVVDDQIAEILRGKTTAERVALIGDAHETAKVLAAAGARLRHPEWNEDQVAREVARRMLGDPA
jgi:hypothetical protein